MEWARKRKEEKRLLAMMNARTIKKRWWNYTHEECFCSSVALHLSLGVRTRDLFFFFFFCRDVFSTKSCKMCALEEHFFSKRRRRDGCRRRDSFESISFARRSVHSERISRDWSFISFGRRLCETRWLRRRLRLVGAQKLVFRTSVSTQSFSF